MAYKGRPAFGLVVKLRTSVGADAVKASKTHGTSDAQLVFTAKTAGASGNSITVALVDPGSDGAISVGVSGSAITVTLGYASAAINSTANDVIAKIYQTPAAAALIDVTPGVGDGSDLVTALSASALTAGTDGTHVYSVIKGLQDVNIPGLSRTDLEFTNHSSEDGNSEYAKSIVREGREITLPLFWDPSDAVHMALKVEEASDESSSFQFVYPFSGQNFQTDALVLDISDANPIKGILTADVKIKFTGKPVSI